MTKIFLSALATIVLGFGGVVYSCSGKMERNQELVREAHRIAAGDDGILSRNEEIKFYKELGIDYTFKKNSRYALYNKADIWATFSEDGRIIERVSNEALENFVMKQGGKR